jgi:hypothetical protein
MIYQAMFMPNSPQNLMRQNHRRMAIPQSDIEGR